MPRRPEFSPEFRERAIRMVVEQTPQRNAQWAAVCSLAEKVGCHRENLRNWVREYERNTGQRPGPTTDDGRRGPDEGARPPTELMVRFIDAHRVAYGVEPICAVLPIAPPTYDEAKARERDRWWTHNRSSRVGRRSAERISARRFGSAKRAVVAGPVVGAANERPCDTAALHRTGFPQENHH